MTAAKTRQPLVKLADLKMHPRNPRRGDIPAIVESIEARGWWGVVVARHLPDDSIEVLAGWHRAQALARVNRSEDRQVPLPPVGQVPVAWFECDDTTALGVVLADNRTSDLAEYDDDLLAELLEELREAGESFGTGWTELDASLLTDLAAVEVRVPSDGVRAESVPMLRWGNKKVVLADDEAELLDSAHSEYMDRYGTDVGFVRALMGEPR